MHEWVERQPSEEARRRIAQPIGRPRMRAFMHGQGKQQNDEGNEDLSDVDVEQGVFRLRPTRKKRKNSVREFGADCGRQFFPCGTPDASHAAELRQQRAPSSRSDARDLVQVRPKVAHRSSLAVDVTRTGELRRACAGRAAGRNHFARARWDPHARGCRAAPLRRCQRQRDSPGQFAESSYAASCPLPPSITIRSGNGRLARAGPGSGGARLHAHRRSPDSWLGARRSSLVARDS